MKSRASSSLFLLLLLGLLGAVYWFGFKDRTPALENEPVATRQQVQIMNIETSQLQEVSWEAGSNKGTLQRSSDTEWKLVNPPIVVDQQKAQSLVSTVAQMNGENKYSFEELSRKDAGLESPAAIVTVKTTDGKSERIIVGKETVDQSYYYVTKDGMDHSTLVYSYVVDELVKDPYTLTPSASESPATLPGTQ